MFYLGIDGGGTKTKAILTNEFGEILGIGYGGPSSIRTVSNEITRRSILDACQEALGDRKFPLRSVFAGLGDIESLKDKELVQSIINDMEFISDSTLIKVESDVYNALYAGLGNYKEGVSVIIGTGSVAFGIKDGLTKRVGGYSFKEGDPGSSFYLGRLCLWHISKVLDGRRSITSFGNELLNILGVTSRISYVEMLDDYYNDRTKTAQLAKVVTSFASVGDKYAIEIMNDGVCAKQLKLSNKYVAIIGSLGKSPLYFERINEELTKIDPKYILFESILDPSLGALIGALKNDNVQITENVIDTLKRQ
jgi:N-acetylglucosamine kinase-like BadF-type ATPase